MKNLKSIRGFTLIEVLVVLGIIGILAAGMLATLNISTQLKKSRDAKRKQELRQILNALELYYNDHGEYPRAINSVRTCAYGAMGCYAISTDDMGSSTWLSQLDSQYISKMPRDPKNTGSGYPYQPNNYKYAYGNVSADRQSFDLIAQLENDKDPDRCGIRHFKLTDSQDWCLSATSTTTCTAVSGNGTACVYDVPN